MNGSGVAGPARRRRGSPLREYLEVLIVIVAVSGVIAWIPPLSYHAKGQVYLLTVIVLCLRVGRGPVLFAAIVSAIAWNYIFIPPRLSFLPLNLDDAVLLGTYWIVALAAGQMTARIREQERDERQRERRATALFHLTQALVSAHTLDEAVTAALRQADELFSARTAFLLGHGADDLVLHPASSHAPDASEWEAARLAVQLGCETGRFTREHASARAFYFPMMRTGGVLGVLGVRLSDSVRSLPSVQRDLLAGFAAQITLLVEREQLRAAGEREKLLLESDRLHRTLFDSVSHELKTPLSVLRSAGERLDARESAQPGLAEEIRTAVTRLDHLVANLLNQTRLQSGSLQPHLDWCDARDIINAGRHAVGKALAGRPLKLEIPEDMPLFLADAPLMEQVMANLLLNAALHTPPGTPVLIRAGVDGGAESRRVFLAVIDQGPGIPLELRGNLFKKFQRGGARARAGGLGLGLSIVHGFMTVQGGEVTALDDPEGGTRFTLYLPYAMHDSVPNDEP